VSTEATTDVPAMLERLQRDGIEHLWVVYHDYSGRAMAKTVPRASFETALTEGVVFALANLNMDIVDHQPPRATLLANTGDFLAVPDPRSYAVVPVAPKKARMYAWMRATDGSVWEGCPRTRLDKVVAELAQAGFSVQCAFEPEFYLLNKGPDGEYHPVNPTRMMTRDGLAAEINLVQRIMHDLELMGRRIPQFGKEYGPGQYEVSTYHGPPIKAVDDYLTLKDVIRDAARTSGYVASFMPKIYADWAGSSLHVHLSLWDAAGETDLTPSSADNTSLSDLGRWFMGGLLRHAPALTGLGSPTVNSYKRLQPGSWAPANPYWGYGNRSAVIRIPGVGTRRHIEYRSGDNSCQPYLFLTGLLAAGLDGIRNQIDPGDPFDGDVGHLTLHEIERLNLGFLPRSLEEGLAALEADEVVAGAVGDEALRHFLLVKRHELEQYDVHVHPWERDTYLEVV